METLKIEDIEQTCTFRELHKPAVDKTVEKILQQFGKRAFTRSHVTALIVENRLCRDRPIKSLDETVRAAMINLEKDGVIEKTGEKKFNRLLYRRVK